MYLKGCVGNQTLQYIHKWYEKETRNDINKFTEMQMVQDSWI